MRAASSSEMVPEVLGESGAEVLEVCAGHGDGHGVAGSNHEACEAVEVWCEGEAEGEGDGVDGGVGRWWWW